MTNGKNIHQCTINLDQNTTGNNACNKSARYEMNFTYSLMSHRERCSESSIFPIFSNKCSTITAETMLYNNIAVEMFNVHLSGNKKIDIHFQGIL